VAAGRGLELRLSGPAGAGLSPALRARLLAELQRVQPTRPQNESR